jgi:hypothetical protein
MRTVAFVAVLLVATAAFFKRAVAGHDGDYTAERTASIAATGARQVAVEDRAGDLQVIAVEGTDAVRVRGTAHASRSGLLDDIKVELRREGDRVTVRAVIPEHARRFWFGAPARQALDMVVEVPAGLEADVTAGSGDAEVRGVSALRVKDSSGDLRVVDVRGPVRVHDGSGNLEVSGVGGDVWLEDGSGDASLQRVAGALVVASDGSGNLSASHVQGDVLVRSDGSGDIDVANVGGGFIVQRDGSGAVRYDDVRGRVEIPRKKAAHH